MSFGKILQTRLLWKTLKSIGLPKKGKTEAKVCLTDNNEMFYEPKEVSRIFKNFYENLAQSLVDKLTAASHGHYGQVWANGQQSGHHEWDLSTMCFCQGTRSSQIPWPSI